MKFIKQIWLVIVSVLLAGFDPFLPWGSFILAWAAVLGVKRRGWRAISGLIIGGLVRDVLLISRLGETGVVACGIWFLAAVFGRKIGQFWLISFLSAVLGASILFALENNLTWFNILATAIYSLGFWLIFMTIVREEKGIRLRS